MRLKILFFLAFLLVGVVASSAIVLDIGPREMDLNAQTRHDRAPGIPKKDKKRVKKFPHRLHQDKFLLGNSKYAIFKYTDDFTCTGCHHKDKKGSQPRSCFNCKDLPDMIEAVGGRFEGIFHKNCRDGCHKPCCSRA